MNERGPQPQKVTDDMAEIRNVDQWRKSIDEGHTGDKVNSPDPAAAPLGTDAEAGGVSPSKAEVALDVASTPLQRPKPAPGNVGLYIYLGAIALLIGLVLAIFAIAR